MERPAPNEHHAYYRTYIDKVPPGDIVDLLRSGIDDTTALLAGRPEPLGDHRYAPGKWTVKEVLAHLIDAERTFVYRAFWFARKAPDRLPGYEQDAFTTAANASARSMASLLDEFRAVRLATVAFFASIDDEVSRRTGIASDFEFSVRAFAWIVAGHEIHHRGYLRDHYLTSFAT